MHGQSNESMRVSTMSLFYPGYGGSPYGPAGDGKSSGKYGESFIKQYVIFQNKVQYHEYLF